MLKNQTFSWASTPSTTILDDDALPQHSTYSLPFKVAIVLFTSSTSHLGITPPASTTAAIAMTTVASIAMANTGSGSQPGAESGECHLLGSFALVIQGSLGLLALLSLVYKRWRERPQRPLKIWAFDASKQVVGSMLLHVANLLMSMLSSGQLSVTLATVAGPGEYQANPCSFYLLNLAIDVSSIPFDKALWLSPADFCTVWADHNRNSHPHISSAPPYAGVYSHTPWRSPGIHTVWQLWATPKSNLVAKTVLHLFPWSIRHEILRVHHLPAVPMDHPSGRLGAQVDGRQRKSTGLFRYALFPGCDERLAVLHYR